MNPGDRLVELAAGVVESSAQRTKPAEVGQSIRERCGDRGPLVIAWLEAVAATIRLELDAPLPAAPPPPDLDTAPLRDLLVLILARHSQDTFGEQADAIIAALAKIAESAR